MSLLRDIKKLIWHCDVYPTWCEITIKNCNCIGLGTRERVHARECVFDKLLLCAEKSLTVQW